MDIEKLVRFYEACKSRVGYTLGAKAPLGTDPELIKRIDCSGFARLAYHAGSGIKLPDGSQNQLAWARKNLRQIEKYSNVLYAKDDPSRLFIAFLSPRKGEEWPRHVWFVRAGKTMESYSSHGVGSRSWNHPSLRFCKDCFEVV